MAAWPSIRFSEIEVPEGFNPRREFDEAALEQLAASIKKNGITTALTVAREDGHFVLVDQLGNSLYGLIRLALIVVKIQFDLLA